MTDSYERAHLHFHSEWETYKWLKRMIGAANKWIAVYKNQPLSGIVWHEVRRYHFADLNRSRARLRRAIKNMKREIRFRELVEQMNDHDF